MSEEKKTIENVTNSEYKWGFVSNIEEDAFPKGLNEDVVRKISEIKGEPDWLLEWRLKAYKHWLTLEEPKWPKVKYKSPDFRIFDIFPHQNKSQS